MAGGKHLNPVAFGAAAAGLVMIWSGIKGASVLKTLQSLIRGEQPAGSADYPITTPEGGGSGQPADTGPTTGGGSPEQNKALAKLLAAPYGWSTGSNWDSLVKLWNRESGWRTTAANPSGAYGIPQSKPGSKMASEGADWKTNPATQIRWGLKYIKGRYGSPDNAWAHSQQTGWY